jgi:hypothetical protein
MMQVVICNYQMMSKSQQQQTPPDKQSQLRGIVTFAASWEGK